MSDGKGTENMRYNPTMLDAPRQDWQWYEERTRAADAAWLRSLTTADRWALLCDMFNLVHRNRDPNADWARLEKLRWQQKLADRQDFVEACLKLDAWRERMKQRGAE